MTNDPYDDGLDDDADCAGGASHGNPPSPNTAQSINSSTEAIDQLAEVLGQLSSSFNIDGDEDDADGSMDQ